MCSAKRRQYKIIYQKAFGKANLELDADLQTDNVLEMPVFKLRIIKNQVLTALKY